MSKQPIAVLISDVHYSLPTLELADKAMNMAIDKANALDVPLIVAGDLHDTKANLRAECVQRLTDTFFNVQVHTYILRGNHDSLNEKSDVSALSFLHGIQGKVEVIDQPKYTKKIGLALVPYQSDPDKLRQILKTTPSKCFILHQGLKNSNSGEYGDFDKTAIIADDCAGLRIISGHYHARQTIALPNSGTWDYIGNPYTLTFSEARDPEKGFQVMYDDGSLEFVPTNLRKHVVFDLAAQDVHGGTVLIYNPDDLLWLKITGTKDGLGKLDRHTILAKLNINAASVRIDLSATDTMAEKVAETANLTLDDCIVMANIPEDQKERLKSMWRTL